MVYAALRKSLKSKSINQILRSIPSQYTLNTGHVTFFYDKLVFLQKRYDRLISELLSRGYNLDPDRTYTIDEFPSEFKKDWTMNQTAKDVICQRIMEKFDMKPNWYKYLGDTIDRQTYEIILKG